MLIAGRDLILPPIGNLAIQQPNAESPRRSTRLNRGTLDEPPLPAPIPTRVSNAPMQPHAPVAGMWNPEMGIKFGGVSPAAMSPGHQAQGGPWDPNSGLRFG